MLLFFCKKLDTRVILNVIIEYTKKPYLANN